jgi:hypothetical protein
MISQVQKTIDEIPVFWKERRGESYAAIMATLRSSIKVESWGEGNGRYSIRTG